MPKNQIKDDLVIMDIKEEQILTKDYVTSKYKKLAKIRHPDKEGGNTGEFQVLFNAYRRIIKYLDDMENTEPFEDKERDFETEFFTKHNFMKECTASYVVYIEDEFVERWRMILEKHISTKKIEKGRAIFKTGVITITLYERPKKDPRSKLHIQSGDQEKNLNFENIVCKMWQILHEQKRIETTFGTDAWK